MVNHEIAKHYCNDLCNQLEKKFNRSIKVKLYVPECVADVYVKDQTEYYSVYNLFLLYPLDRDNAVYAHRSDLFPDFEIYVRDDNDNFYFPPEFDV